MTNCKAKSVARISHSLPQAGGGRGWGLFSQPKTKSGGTAVAPTLTLPRLGGGNLR